jgi:phosphopantothenoylcysteine decarboxylase/phosphopantothenate--cysteine ligase
MGYGIAAAAIEAGAKVHLISGKVSLSPPTQSQLHQVDSALDMHQKALELASQCDIFIACAAVADYRPANMAEQKIKKSGEQMTLTLVKNPDIVADVAALKQNRPFTVGFAAETQDVAHYAQDKMQRKKLDMICANDVSIAGQGFNAEQNALQVFWPQGNEQLPLSNKKQLSQALVQLISRQYQTQTTSQAD